MFFHAFPLHPLDFPLYLWCLSRASLMLSSVCRMIPKEMTCHLLNSRTPLILKKKSHLWSILFYFLWGVGSIWWFDCAKEDESPNLKHSCLYGRPLRSAEAQIAKILLTWSNEGHTIMQSLICHLLHSPTPLTLQNKSPNICLVLFVSEFIIYFLAPPCASRYTWIVLLSSHRQLM